MGSHYHFFEVNPALHFDRLAARGFRLNIDIIFVFNAIQPGFCNESIDLGNDFPLVDNFLLITQSGVAVKAPVLPLISKPCT